MERLESTKASQRKQIECFLLDGSRLVPQTPKIAGQIAGQTGFEGGEVPISLGKLVRPARFQRATFRLGGGRSMQLSYGRSE